MNVLQTYLKIVRELKKRGIKIDSLPDKEAASLLTLHQDATSEFWLRHKKRREKRRAK